MTPRLREMLNTIDGFLQETGDGRDLALVLSALRGPDASGIEGVDAVKMQTTAAIRTAAFPGLAKMAELPKSWKGASEVWKMADPRDFRDPEGSIRGVLGWHFLDHVTEAARVLELPWY